MSKAEIESHSERAQALRTVLNHAVELSPDQATFVRELIDVGELGLAFAFLCEYLDDLGDLYRERIAKSSMHWHQGSIAKNTPDTLTTIL